MSGMLTRREFEILLACAAPTRSAVPLLTPDLDWEHLWTAATEHRLLTFLVAAAREAPESALPPSIHARLAATERDVRARGLLLTHQLGDLLSLLSSAGIPAMALKGPILGQILYGDPAIRRSTDIDLLVRTQDGERATDVLRAHGYCDLLAGLPPAALRRWQAVERELLFRAASDLLVEVHLALDPSYLPFKFDTDAVWERGIAVDLGDFTARTLGPEDLILYLCLHATKHHWSRLLWLADLARALQRFSGLDWEHLAATARGQHAARGLGLGLLLAERLLGAPTVAPALTADRNVRRLALMVEARLRAGGTGNLRGWPNIAFTIMASDRLAELFPFLAYRFHRVLTPRLEDYRAWRLPHLLYPLYYLRRPLRLAVESARSRRADNQPP